MADQAEEVKEPSRSDDGALCPHHADVICISSRPISSLTTAGRTGRSSNRDAWARLHGQILDLYIVWRTHVYMVTLTTSVLQQINSIHAAGWNPMADWVWIVAAHRIMKHDRLFINVINVLILMGIWQILNWFQIPALNLLGMPIIILCNHNKISLGTTYQKSYSYHVHISCATYSVLTSVNYIS